MVCVKQCNVRDLNFLFHDFADIYFLQFVEFEHYH